MPIDPDEYFKPPQQTGAKADLSLYVTASSNRVGLDDLGALGLSEGGVRGVYENLIRESGRDPNAVGDGGTSYGLAQWHKERKQELLDFAKKNSLDPADPRAQVQFLKQDLDTKYPVLAKRLRDPKITSQEANDLFMRVYERPASTNPVYEAGNWRVDPATLERAEKTRGAQVRYMSPADYLALAPDFEGDPWTDRKGQSLKASLAKGEPIDDLPSLTLKGGQVTDQDGRHRALAAKEAGVTAIPVLMKGLDGDLPKEIVGLSGRILPGDFKRRAAIDPDSYFQAPTVPGMAERIARTVARPLYGVAQVLEHSGAFDLADRIPHPAWLDQPLFGEKAVSADEGARINEQQIKEARGPNAGTDWLGTGIEVANPINYAGGGLMRGGGLVRALAGGALAGAMQPATGGGDFWTQKAEQAGVGAAGGAVGMGVGNALGRMVAPLGGDAGALARAGVRLTPGQMAGGMARRAEEALGSQPVVGSMVRHAQNAALADFNRAAINRALEPMGARLPPGVAAGNEAIGAARTTLGAAYDRLLPRMSFTADRQFAADLQNLGTLVSEMPPPQAAQFRTIVRNRLMQRLQPNGRMDGETLKQVESELANAAAEWRPSGDAAHRQLATALDEVRNLLRQNLQRQNPAHAGELQNINAAYARFKRVEAAAANRSTSDGVFTPGDLLTAVKRGDRTAGKGAFARGDALMQDIAQQGQRVLGRILPDSGTTERLAWGGLVGGAGLGISPGAALALGGATAPYTRPGLNFLRLMATMLPNTRNYLSQGVRQAAPYAAPPAAAVGVSSLQPGM